ncbi:hypothetical protein GQX74_001146 [Glossina fuscipes]|nr:hypothetical protein GQX74_001146 [Glossina fuscipes]
MNLLIHATRLRILLPETLTFWDVVVVSCCVLMWITSETPEGLFRSFAKERCTRCGCCYDDGIAFNNFRKRAMLLTIRGRMILLYICALTVSSNDLRFKARPATTLRLFLPYSYLIPIVRANINHGQACVGTVKCSCGVGIFRINTRNDLLCVMKIQ